MYADPDCSFITVLLLLAKAEWELSRGRINWEAYDEDDDRVTGCASPMRIDDPQKKKPPAYHSTRGSKHGPGDHRSQAGSVR